MDDAYLALDQDGNFDRRRPDDVRGDRRSVKEADRLIKLNAGLAECILRVCSSNGDSDM